MIARQEWRDVADQVFAAHPSVATVSIVNRALVHAMNPDAGDARVVQTSTAAWPACFVNPAVVELLELSETGAAWSADDVAAVTSSASLRGLHHAWVSVADGGADRVEHLVGPLGERVVLGRLPVDELPTPQPIALGIDAEWLLGGESGAQVFVCELLRALAPHEAITKIVLLSDSGGVPAALADVPKLSGHAWRQFIESHERLDILHRPYQPGIDTDFGRYRQVARTVALTVLDFIAYDSVAYHESTFAYREYQRAFDRLVTEADQLFAISAHVGGRLQRQFSHRLMAPVRSILPGADHLDARPPDGPLPAALLQAGVTRYLLVLGNDFAHKNRDFAVKVFAELCRRGYDGHLVLAGFHLDAGSSYSYEMRAAGAASGRVLRTGPLSPADKIQALGHADAVLYPTSSEGFGLIPFEAASLATPTAFVRFGPMRESLPDVPAAPAWRVTDFADHVETLLSAPGPFLAAVDAARRRLTWAQCARLTIDGYRSMLDDATPWRSALVRSHRRGVWQRATELASEYARRAARRVSRLTAASPRQFL